jgi:hypothetical protein
MAVRCQGKEVFLNCSSDIWRALWWRHRTVGNRSGKSGEITTFLSEPKAGMVGDNKKPLTKPAMEPDDTSDLDVMEDS